MVKVIDATNSTTPTTPSTPAKCSPAQFDNGTGYSGNGAAACEAIAETASSCTITASKVDSKLRTPIKMGIAASITVKKDSGDHSDCKAEISEGQIVPEYISIESTDNKGTDDQPSRTTEVDRKDYPSENCNNNNNLESSSVLANYIQCGSVVFNLQSSSEPTLQKASRVETLGCKDNEEKAEGVQEQVQKSETVKDTEVKQPKSRLPVKAAGWSFHTQGKAIGKQKPKGAVKVEVRRKGEPAIAKVEPRSRIPIKDVKRTPPAAMPSTSSLGLVKASSQPTRVLPIERKAIQLPSRLPLKEKQQVSKVTAVEVSKQVRKENPSDVCKRTIEYFKDLSGETQKLVDRLSDEEKKTQTEQSEEDSTSRSTSLSDASQPSQPSGSSSSGRGPRAEAGAASVRAKVAATDRASGSERSRRSRRTGGKEGSQGLTGSRTPPIAEIKPSL